MPWGRVRGTYGDRSGLPWEDHQLFEIGPPWHAYRYHESEFAVNGAPVYQCCRAVDPGDDDHRLFVFRVTDPETKKPAEWVAKECPTDTKDPVNTKDGCCFVFRTIRKDIADMAVEAKKRIPVEWQEYERQKDEYGRKTQHWDWGWHRAFEIRPRPPKMAALLPALGFEGPAFGGGPSARM